MVQITLYPPGSDTPSVHDGVETYVVRDNGVLVFQVPDPIPTEIQTTVPFTIQRTMGNQTIPGLE